MGEPLQNKGEGGQNEAENADASIADQYDPKDLHVKLDQLIKDTTTNTKKDKNYNPDQLKDQSRKVIAYAFVFSFIGIVIAVLIIIPIYNALVFHDARVVIQETQYQPLDIEKILAGIGAILGTPLGFVVGYYFKEQQQINKRNK